MNAAPNPCAARAAISSPRVTANPAASEATATANSPAMNTRRRPRRSAARPPSSRNPPNAMMYAFTTHGRSLSEKCSPLAMLGSATFTIEASRTTTNCATVSSASATQRRSTSCQTSRSCRIPPVFRLDFVSKPCNLSLRSGNLIRMPYEMSTAAEQLTREPMIRLLSAAFMDFSDELFRRFAAAGFGDIRPGHGCVFGYIAPEGSRLTDMAESARMTKQSVGEAATDLERRGYVERCPDATDGRVKIIRLTERGQRGPASRPGVDRRNRRRLGPALWRGRDRRASRDARGDHRRAAQPRIRVASSSDAAPCESGSTSGASTRRSNRACAAGTAGRAGALR